MADKTWSQGASGLTRRLQEVAPGEYAEEVYNRDAWSAAIALGRAYLLGTGRLSLGLAGSISALVQNPADSGVKSTVLVLTAFATGTGWATVRRNPTGGLPTTERVRQVMNPHPGHGGSTRILAEAGLGSLTGGTEGVTIGLPASDRTPIGPLGFPLAPGESLGVQSSFGASAELAAVVYVVEEPI